MVDSSTFGKILLIGAVGLVVYKLFRKNIDMASAKTEDLIGDCCRPSGSVNNHFKTEAESQMNQEFHRDSYAPLTRNPGRKNKTEPGPFGTRLNQYHDFDGNGLTVTYT